MNLKKSVAWFFVEDDSCGQTGSQQWPSFILNHWHFWNQHRQFILFPYQTFKLYSMTSKWSSAHSGVGMTYTYLPDTGGNVSQQQSQRKHLKSRAFINVTKGLPGHLISKTLKGKNQQSVENIHATPKHVDRSRCMVKKKQKKIKNSRDWHSRMRFIWQKDTVGSFWLSAVLSV